MVFDFALFERARCGVRGRRSLASLVDYFVALAEKARRDGLLSLEADIDERHPDPFIELGLRLVLDGTSSECIDEVLITSIYSSGLRGKDLLARMMAYTGIRGILEGYAPEIIEKMLGAYIGLEGKTTSEEPDAKPSEEAEL